MTLPTIVPVGLQGNATDFLKTKCDRSGALRLNAENVSVPSGTTTTTIVGLVPFNKGARIDVGASKVHSAALGASVTAGLGVVYLDNVNNVDNQTLFASASTAVAAGGEIPLLVNAATLQYVTTGDGWVVLTVGGATTGSTGTVSAQVAIAYDGLNAINVQG